MHLSAPIPVIRIFSEQKAKEFYIDFLGFSLEWEHRFDDAAPLYAQVRRGDMVLHLSEHHGDATPGSTSYVPIHEVDWGRTMEVTDPFGNRFRFCETNDE